MCFGGGLNELRRRLQAIHRLPASHLGNLRCSFMNPDQSDRFCGQLESMCSPRELDAKGLCERLRRVCGLGSRRSRFNNPLGPYDAGLIIRGLPCIWGSGLVRFGSYSSVSMIATMTNCQISSNQTGRLGKSSCIQRRHHRPMKATNHHDCDPGGHGAT